MTTFISNSLLHTVGHFLKDIPDIRLEWSLEISEACIKPRPLPLFWVGLKNSVYNVTAFEKVAALLSQLNCPNEIISIQQELSPSSISQGIRISTDENQDAKCLYIQFRDDTGKEKIIAYKWSSKGTAYVYYQFQLFKTVPDYKNVIHQLHPDLKQCFASLLDNEKLVANSGFSYQYTGKNISEVYLTYYWQPELSDILESFTNNISGISADAMMPYRNLHFRHIGLSSSRIDRASVTIYFSAPLMEEWPCTFSELQTEVTLSGKRMHTMMLDFEKV